jgi:hypothetical protein
MAEHRSDLAPLRSSNDGVADPERATLYEERHDGTTARVEVRLDHGAGCLSLRIRSKLLDLSDEKDALEELVEACLGLRRLH